MAKSKAESNNDRTRLEVVNELIENYLQGKYVSIPADIYAEMKDIFLKTYSRPICSTCTGDLVKALDLLQKKLMKNE